MNRKIFIFLLIGVLLGIAGSQVYKSSVKNEDSPSAVEQDTIAQTSGETSSGQNNLLSAEATKEKVPDKVLVILKYVETFHEPKNGYVGGSVFNNYENILPKKTSKGIKIKYREWDVNPKKKGVNRGAERLVTGDNKSAWYTKDHYKSFIKIR